MIATGLFLGLCLLAGGASRVSDAPLVLIRPLAVLLIGAVLALVPLSAWRSCRQPLLLLGAFAAIMAIQLIPLPPALWARLPLSTLYVDALAGAGLDERWRPLSIAPDLTINSLLALLPPLAVLLAVATWSPRNRERLLTWILAGVALSAVLGLAQFVGGTNSRLYLWIDRSEAVANGVFANRNHHAVFLACGLALLGDWIAAAANGRRHGAIARQRLAIGAGLMVLFMVTALATGSRTGTGLCVLAAGYSYWRVARQTDLADAAAPRAQRLALRWGWIILIVLLAVMALSSRAVTLERLANTDASADQRVRSLPVMLDMLARVFPWGSGFGTFDPFFRAFEPDRLLHPGIFNHAHNDMLEMLLVGGLPALLVMLAAAGWLGWTAIRLFRASPSPPVLLGRAAAFAIGLIVVASAVDYPVRTPLVAVFSMILALWMTDGVRQDAPPGESG